MFWVLACAGLPVDLWNGPVRLPCSRASYTEYPSLSQKGSQAKCPSCVQLELPSGV